jgi:hypothetical protein
MLVVVVLLDLNTSCVGKLRWWNGYGTGTACSRTLASLNVGIGSSVTKARFLKSWSDHFVGNIHLQLAIAKEVLEKLKSAGNHRPLAQHEAVLRACYVER